MKGSASLYGVVLEFTETDVIGFTELPQGANDCEVKLLFNETEIQTIRTSGDLLENLPFRAKRFSFKLWSLWRYVKKDDKISVIINDAPLPISGHGKYYSPKKNGVSKSVHMINKLNTGWKFNQKGRLRLSMNLDTEWQLKVFHLYEELRVLFRENFDLDIFISYGTLLGAIRSESFIGADHDFDVAFISRHTDPIKAKLESAEIIRFLHDAGYKVEVKPSVFYVTKSNSDAKIDVNRLLFDENGNLQSAFGLAGISNYTVDDFNGVEEVNINGFRVHAPSKPKVMLEAIYGSSWLVPNVGFNWDRERRSQMRQARFSGKQIIDLKKYVGGAFSEK